MCSTDIRVPFMIGFPARISGLMVILVFQLSVIFVVTVPVGGTWRYMCLRIKGFYWEEACAREIRPSHFNLTAYMRSDSFQK